MSDPICMQEGCQSAATGKCLEGFDPVGTCPYLPHTAATTSDDTASSQTAFVGLPSGEALSEIEASEVTGEAPTRVVILAGPADSGKTTVVTSLFESFLEAPFANFLFAGSNTLVGFERRCHEARVASGRCEPHTSHTPVSDTVEFLHLRVISAGVERGSPVNVLLADISGERFRSLRDSVDAVRAMKVLRRADFFTLVLDGGRLCDINQRFSVRNDARLLLRSIVEADVLSPTCRIDLVVAKWDLIVTNDQSAEIKSFVADTTRSLEAFIQQSGGIRVQEIAARPQSKRLPFAHGLATLFASWFGSSDAAGRRGINLPVIGTRDREIDRFGTLIVQTHRPGAELDVRRV